MVDHDALVEALSIVFTFGTIFWLIIGITIGIGFGAMPGLQASTALALGLPLTFTMPLGSAFGLLIGLYKGSIYGGSISAICFATPGTPEAAATVFDGYKMMRAGKGRKALLMALYASVTGDFVSDVITIVVAPVLALAALKFGPSERFWLIALAVTLIGGLSGRHLAKGMFSAAFGLFIGTIGTDPVGLVSRNTFGVWWLQDGIPLPPMMIGVFAGGVMIEESIKLLRANEKVTRLGESFSSMLKKGEGLSFREYLSTWKEMIIGTGIGTFVGFLPGLGATVAAFLSYTVAKQVSPSKKIGTGVLNGIAAAESGNNATTGPSLVPLLVFGIPGSTTAALLGSALIMHGATPSPRMFEMYPHIIYSLFIILLIGNVANLGIGRIFAFIYAKIGELPRQTLIPLIILIAVVGTYSASGNPFDVVIMLVFAFIGFAMRVFGIPEAPMVITFLVIPIAEGSLRKALLINRGDWLLTLFHSPLAIALFIFCVVVVAIMIRVHVTHARSQR